MFSPGIDDSRTDDRRAVLLSMARGIIWWKCSSTLVRHSFHTFRGSSPSQRRCSGVTCAVYPAATRQCAPDSGGDMQRSRSEAAADAGGSAAQPALTDPSRRSSVRAGAPPWHRSSLLVTARIKTTWRRMFRFDTSHTEHRGFGLWQRVSSLLKNVFLRKVKL